MGQRVALLHVVEEGAATLTAVSCPAGLATTSFWIAAVTAARRALNFSMRLVASAATG